MKNCQKSTFKDRPKEQMAFQLCNQQH